MKEHVVPIQLLARISDASSKDFTRYAIFTLSVDDISVKRIFNTFRADLKKVGISGKHKLVWFRCGKFVTVLVSGTPAITNYVFSFVAKGKQRKLFKGGVVVFEGVSLNKFKDEAAKLLKLYSVPAAKHGYGGN
jgi:hypothetical protein